MASSIKVFKANKVFGSNETTKINTEFVEDEVILEEASEEESLAVKVQQTENKSQSIVAQAELESQKIIEEAKEEAKKIKAEAKTIGFNEGREKGHQQGLNEGLKQSETENKALRASIMTMIQEAQTELAQYKEDNKQNIILLASHMAEKIVHKQIDHTSESILLLAKPFLYQLEKIEEFVTITVHPSQKEQLEEHRPEVESISPNTRFMIFSDANLEERGLIIESSKAVIDLQVKKQIDTMMQEFEEMERTVDA